MAILILRKAWRLSAVIFPLLYYFTHKNLTLIITSLVLFLFIIIEFLRFSNPRFNTRLFNAFKFILKESERKRILTTTPLLISVLLTVILFSKDIAIMALLFLIFGDIASALVGKNFGRIMLGKKTLEGSFAFFLSCLIVAVFVNNLTSIHLTWPVVLFGALTATLVELLPLPIDDNFTIALSSGIIMTIVNKLI